MKKKRGSERPQETELKMGMAGGYLPQMRHGSARIFNRGQPVVGILRGFDWLWCTRQITRRDSS